MRNSYDDLLRRFRAKWGEKFDASGLSAEFVRYYQSGERIRVDMRGLDSEEKDSYGHTIITGTVGVTTGWRPCFLLMRTTRSIGSPWTLDGKDRILAVRRGRVYVEVRS